MARATINIRATTSKISGDLNHTLSFIICANGYGHYKRVCAVAKSVLEQNNEVNIHLFCDTRQFEKLKDWPETKFLCSSPFVFFNHTGMDLAPGWLDKNYNDC